MDILGVGPLELAFIILIALIVLGPNDMVKAGRSLGRFMRRLVMSDTWKVLTGVSREIRSLPTRLIREAGLEEMQQQLAEVKEANQEIRQQLAEVRQASRSIGGQLNQDLNAIGQGAPTAPTPEAGTPPSPSAEPALTQDITAGLAAWTTPPPQGSPAPAPDETPPAEDAG
jgi:Sec-independent protein translocase protein TatA